MIQRVHRSLLILVILATMGAWQPALAQLAVTSVSVKPAAGGEEVRFVTSAEITPRKVFVLQNPDRAVIDLPLIEATAITLPSNYRGTLIRSIRFGRFDAETSRIVIDLAGPCAALTTIGGDHLSISLRPTGIAGVKAPSTFSALDTPPYVPPASGGDKGGATLASPVVAEAKKPLIVIDAGHGGDDPGAIGLRNTREKVVTITFARALKESLLRTGRYRVALTRDGDRFIKLHERVAIARELNGDMFVSLHADSNPRKEAQGLSIYSLSENASDDESAALAERENKADIIPGIDLNGADEDVANILIDLTQRETMNKSAQLAEAIMGSMHPKVPLLGKTHRYAGFRVLKGPDIPSVLIELGFLSNPADEKRLRSPEYRELVISSIVKGLDRYRAVEGL